MTTKKPYGLYLIAALLMGAVLSTGHHQMASAEQSGEIITKQKTINQVFNEENPGGNVDLKKIVEEELEKPAECYQDMVVCEIQEVTFDITLKKEWRKYNVSQLNDYEFANTVPKLTSMLNQQPKGETVVMQETLARRGLLQNLDGSIVKERGFFGALTWLGLLRLSKIKGLEATDPEFENKLRDEVNDLLNKMAKDDDYIATHQLPQYSERTPSSEDSTFDLWNNYLYLAKLAKNAKPVKNGNIPLGAGVEVNIDGFVNVQRVQD